MSGGGGGSSAPAAAPSGYVSRGSLSPSADASAPGAPLTTLLDPFTRAEASPRTCPRTPAIAPRANATGATSAETTGEAVRHPTPALRTFSTRRARRVCRPQSATETKCRGCDFPFFRLRARRNRARSAPAATPPPDATRGRDATHRTRTLPRARAPMPLATSPCVGPSKP